MKIESKIKELISVVNEYMKQLDELNEKCSNLELENNNIKLVNSDLVNENKKLASDNNKYIEELKNIKNSIDNCEEMSNKYLEQNKQLKLDNENLNNQLMENKQRIDSLLDENNRLNIILNEYKLKISKIENDLNMAIQYQQKSNDKHENDIQDIISYCNDNINNIIKWVDNSFGLNYNSDSSLINNKVLLNSSFSSDQFNINFDELKQKLNNAQEKIYNEFDMMNKSQEESKNKFNLFLSQKEKYLDILKKIYNTVTSEIHEKNYFICDYHIDNFNNPKNDELLQLLNLVDTVINRVLRYLSSVAEEKDLITNEINKYKNNISDLQAINDNLMKENNDCKEKIYNNDYSRLKNDMNNLQEDYNKCIQMNQILEKKIKNYETEFELKQMQINSLEEMVKRRNTENNNSYDYQPGYYNNSNISTSNNNLEKNIKRLEEDREKLIKDNMKLIQYNKKLKEQINNLNQIINNLASNSNNNGNNDIINNLENNGEQ